jgi:predicted RNA binding protein YcfA (HicA-like mRNA interferase family)
MTKADKTLEKMRNNPRDWNLSDLEVVAGRFGINMRRGKSSHVSFSHPTCVDILTVPDHRPIKPIYVKKLISLIESLKEVEYES